MNNIRDLIIIFSPVVNHQSTEKSYATKAGETRKKWNDSVTLKKKPSQKLTEGEGARLSFLQQSLHAVKSWKENQ